MPLAWLSIDTARSRRSLNILLFMGMKSCGPLRASTEAHCEIDDGFEVDCDWMVAIALISSAGPPAEPMRQPVMQKALYTPFTVTRRPYSFGSTAAASR